MASICDRGLIFRCRKAEDDQGLLALFNEECFLRSASAREPFSGCADMRQWLEGIHATQRFEIVGLWQGEIAGFGALYVLGDGQSHSGWIILGVRHRLQQRGIGTALMHLLTSTARIFVGLERIQLTVFSDNAAAIKLYRKFGFEVEGWHRNYARRGKDFLDALTMARLFEARDAASDNDDSVCRANSLQTEWSADCGGRRIAG